MQKVFCGISKLPRGKRYGSMLECAKAKQIRRFGKLKVDNNIIDIAVGETKEKKDRLKKRNEALAHVAKVTVQIRHLKNDLADVEAQISRGEQPFRIDATKGLTAKQREELRKKREGRKRVPLRSKKNATALVNKIKNEIKDAQKKSNELYDLIAELK